MLTHARSYLWWVMTFPVAIKDQDKLEGLGINTGAAADGRHGCWNRSPWLEQMVDEMTDFPAPLSQLGLRISAQVLAIIRSFSRDC